MSHSKFKTLVNPHPNQTKMESPSPLPLPPSPSPSPSPSPALPMKIITEILSRLPVKPLIRFECVSKSFYSLITSPSFSKLHLSKLLTSSNPPRHVLLATTSLFSAPLRDDSKKLTFAALPHNPLKNSPPPPTTPSFFSDTPPPEIQILGSCHGLICVTNWERKDVFLYNPSTGSHRKLPSPDSPYSSDFTNFGLWYDSATDDYKVLRIVQCCGPQNELYSEVKVYSVKDNSWRRIADFPYFLMYRDNHHGVLVEGGLHYIVSEVAYKMDDKRICRFDVSTETCSLVDRPPLGKDESGAWTLYLAELRGCLSFTLNYDFHGKAEVWMMREYGNRESWVKLFRIQKPGSGVNVVQVRPITSSDGGSKILTELENRELAWFNMRRAKMEGIKTSGRPDEDFNTGVFVETLVNVSLGEDKVSQGKSITMPQPARKSQPPPRKPKKKTKADGFLSAGFKLKL